MVKKLTWLIVGLLLGSAVQAQTSRGIVRTEDGPSLSRQRLALVVGNARYASAPLRNPVNDAQQMAQALRRVGFTVEVRLNASQTEMKRAIDEFGRQLKQGGVGLFYYSGHGLQVGGRNYLIPVDAQITGEAEVEYESVDVGRVLAKMEVAQNAMNLVILDACRNNPYARSFRSASQGLAMLNAPSGTFIAYATAPGAVASDGDGETGLYTGELMRHLETPGLKVEEVFKRVRASVQQKSQNAQVPWDVSSLTGDFYFQPGLAASPTNSVRPEVRPPPLFRADEESWKAIQDSQNPEDFRFFLTHFPTSPLAKPARLQLNRLERQATLRAEPPVEVAPPYPVTSAGLESRRRAESREAFERAADAGTGLAFRKFIRQYEGVPEAAFYVKRAETLAEALDSTAAVPSVEERSAARAAYEQAVQSGSALALRQFIKQHASQEAAQFYVNRARARLQTLNP